MVKRKYLKDRFEADFLQLGFELIGQDIIKGRIPNDNDVKDIYIEVEIEYSGYPLTQPNIELKSINGNSELNKAMPIEWRHIDESVNNYPLKSKFYICCLHNWSMNEEYNALFVYDRILAWLKSNVNKHWDIGEDLPSWRVLPQPSDMVLVTTESFVQSMAQMKEDTYKHLALFHVCYSFQGGAKAKPHNLGNKYELKNIASCQSQIKASHQYVFFSEPSTNSAISHISSLYENLAMSDCVAIRWGKKVRFKTVFQLLATLRKSPIIDEATGKGYKNLPMIISYKGDRNREEIVGLLVDINSLKRSLEDSYVRMFQIETLSVRKPLVDLTVALLGVGSLGSLIARNLADKGVKKIVLCDPDRLSADNLGTHELSPFFLAMGKSQSMSHYIHFNRYFNGEMEVASSDEEAIRYADVAIVTVGDSKSFDRLAFDTLTEFDRPVIWAWVSELNILQEMVVTSPNSGCLNCYYRQTATIPELAKLHDSVRSQVCNVGGSYRGVCGDVHVLSQPDRMMFFASQIVTFISFYSRYSRFPFDYVNYYWPLDEVIPTSITGRLPADKDCFCGRGYHET